MVTHKEEVKQAIVNALADLPQNTTIIVATDDEKQIVDEALTTHPLPYDVRIIQTGPGICNTLDALLPLNIDTPILNFGYAGSNKLKKFSILTVNEARHYHPNVSFDRPEPEFLLNTIPNLTSVVCYTSQDFVHNTTIEDPVIFDMELAIIAQLFQNQPIFSLKIVSDNMDFEEYSQTISE